LGGAISDFVLKRGQRRVKIRGIEVREVGLEGTGIFERVTIHKNLGS